MFFSVPVFVLLSGLLPVFHARQQAGPLGEVKDVINGCLFNNSASASTSRTYIEMYAKKGVKDYIAVGCNLTSLPEMCAFPLNHINSTVVNLVLAYNRMAYLPRNGFDCVKNLHDLNVSFNLISLDLNGVFSSLLKLVSLDLSHNRLRYLGGMVFHRWHKELRYINLSHNWIFNLFTNFAMLPSLQHLDLSYNFMDNFTDVITYNLADTNIPPVTIDLRNNSFKSLGVDSLKHILGINSGVSSAEVMAVRIKLQNNPWHCDCGMYQMIKWLTKHFKFLSQVVDDSAGPLRCNSPEQYTGRELSQIRSIEFTCDASNCPPMCNCTTKPNEKVVEINCSKTGLPQLPDDSFLDWIQNGYKIRMDLSRNKITDIGLRKYLNVTSYLDISHNLIENLTEPVMLAMTKVEHLNITSNKIHYLPPFLEGVILTWRKIWSFQIADNPLICTCAMAWLRSISNTGKSIVGDVDKLQCSDRTGWKPQSISSYLIDFCNYRNMPSPNTSYEFIVIPFASFAVIALIAFIVLRKKIRDFVIYQRLKKLFGAPKRVPLSGKKYDVFICYAEGDREWVHLTLVEELERVRPPVKLFFYQKDFRPGIPIAENIAEGLEFCQKVFMVVSKHFVKSSWCIYEFKQAIARHVMNNDIDIVIIMRDPIDTQQLDPDFRQYLLKYVYLPTWEDWFWQKLRESLPKERVRNL